MVFMNLPPPLLAFLFWDCVTKAADGSGQAAPPSRFLKDIPARLIQRMRRDSPNPSEPTLLASSQTGVGGGAAASTLGDENGPGSDRACGLKGTQGGSSETGTRNVGTREDNEVGGTAGAWGGRVPSDAGRIGRSDHGSIPTRPSPMPFERQRSWQPHVKNPVKQDM